MIVFLQQLLHQWARSRSGMGGGLDSVTVAVTTSKRTSSGVYYFVQLAEYSLQTQTFKIVFKFIE